MFTSLADISNLDDELKTNVVQHLEKLECELKSYFSEFTKDSLSLERNSFWLSSEKVEDKLHNPFIDMKNDSSNQDVFEAFPVTDFLLRIASLDPVVSKTAPKNYCDSALHSYVILLFQHFWM